MDVCILTDEELAVLAGARSRPMPGTLSGSLARKDGFSAPPPTAWVPMSVGFASDKGIYVDYALSKRTFPLD